MYRKLIGLACWGLLFGFVLTNGTIAADPSLVGWWKLDETSGQLVVDSSGNGNDGIVLLGDPRWVKGQMGNALYLDGTGYVELPIGSVIESLTDCTIAVWFYWTGEENWQRVFDFGRGTSNYISLCTSVDTGRMRFALKTHQVGEEDRADTTGPLASGWHHVAVTIDSLTNTMTLYLDGANVSSNTNMRNKLSDLGRTHSNWLGRAQYFDPFFEGYWDDLYIFNRVLSQGEITTLQAGGFGREYASQPFPADGEQEVSRDVILSWIPGHSADTHILYFGENFDDVYHAGMGGSPQIGPEQVPDTSYDPSRLEFGKQYFWRVDEVNRPPDNTVFEGDVWSFTVESEVYPIPVENITVTASSYVEGQEPERTVDSSGIDAVNDTHSTDVTEMWLTAENDSLPCWIQYEFNKPYQLNNMMVWNYNGESFLSIYGAKDVVIEHSLDDANGTQLNDVFVFPMASGTPDYSSDIHIDFGNVTATHVKIMAQSNYSSGFYNQCGLSEVRLMTTPLSARSPEPKSGAEGVDPRSVLSWRAGREADTHQVYIDDNEDSVNEGTTPVRTANESYFDLSELNLQLGQTVYWRVDEVNDAAIPPVWTGDTWSFTVSETIVLDDFESYSNTSPHRPFQTWIDGLGFTQPEPGHPGNNTGAAVGHDIWTPDSNHVNGFIVENLIAHSDTQSLPLYYDNSGANGRLTYSQIDWTFTSGQDWTRFGVTTLVVHFYGSEGNSGQLYVKINDTPIPYPGPSADLAMEVWTAWEIDLASSEAALENVSTLSIGIEDANASGLLYIDDIWLK